MSFCEGRSTPAICLICSKRAAITFDALRMFEAALPLLHASIRGRENDKIMMSIDKNNNKSNENTNENKKNYDRFNKVDQDNIDIEIKNKNKIYLSLVARDPFSSLSENIYT